MFKKILFISLITSLFPVINSCDTNVEITEEFEEVKNDTEISNSTPSYVPDKDLLSYQDSCGDVSSSTTTWYRVFGSAEVLAKIKSNYCGDAFLKGDNTTQLASFTSRTNAQAFVNQLSKETGLNFWIQEATISSSATPQQNSTRKALNATVTGFFLDSAPITRSGEGYYDNRVIAFPYYMSSRAQYEYVCPINGGRLISDGYARSENISEECRVILDSNGVPRQVELYDSSNYRTIQAVFSGSSNSQSSRMLPFHCPETLAQQKRIVQKVADKEISFATGQVQLERISSKVNECI